MKIGAARPVFLKFNVLFSLQSTRAPKTTRAARGLGDNGLALMPPATPIRRCSAHKGLSRAHCNRWRGGR